MKTIKLSTPVMLPGSSCQVSYHNRLLSLGSCFSSNLADYLSSLSFRIVSNPYGPLYNPISIARCIEEIREGKVYSEDDLFYYGGLYHSEMHHGSFSRSDKKQMLLHINRLLAEASQIYRSCDRLIITFGTARVYRNKQTGLVVGNCHKQPADMFVREDLPVDTMLSVWTDLVGSLLEEKSDLRILLSVSPIRHMGDGLVTNSRSKSRLLLLCESLEQINPDRIEYFPSYEIMMDELRDYRFYADDMKHPSDLAIEIICRRFLQSHASKESLAIMKEVESYQKLRSHKILHDGTLEAEKFRREVSSKYNLLKEKYPFLCL